MYVVVFHQDVLVESGVVGQNTVNGVMSGKFYNGSVRCHKIMHEALEIIRFQCFMDNCSPERASEIESLLCNIRDAFLNEEFYDYLESPELKGIIDEYETFIEMASKQFPTFALWSTYIEITGISVSMYANPDTFMYNTLFRKFNIKESQLFSFSKLFDFESQTRLESICLRNQFFLSFLSYNPVESHA